MYLYDAFDTTDTFSGIINMSDYHYNDDWDCAADYCEFKHMNLELEEGDYAIVTTTNGEYDSSVVLNNSIFNFDGDLITYSNSELRNAYHEYVDGEKTLVAGDERLYFPGYYWYYYVHNYYDDHHEDHYDYSYELMMAFRENMTAYEDGDMNATMSADNILGILIAMDDEGFFDYHDDHHDDLSLIHI